MDYDNSLKVRRPFAVRLCFRRFYCLKPFRSAPFLLSLIFIAAFLVSAQAKRLEVLFLGDEGHHKPAERIPQIMEGLGPRGVNFTYTADPDCLHDETLKNFDALMIYANIVKTPSGEGRVKEIADEIHLGAMVFMASEYKRLAIFCLICIIALYASLGTDTAIAFTLGALCSGTAGYIGMYSATKANVRTAVAANTKGAAAALNVAFFGGSIMGLTVASMGLLGIGILYHFMGGTRAR